MMNGFRGMMWKLASGVLLVVALSIGSYAATRASKTDVKTNADEIAAVRREVNQRLTRVETNVVKTCQFLDRQDKLNGGPGLDCQDPR